MLYHLSLLVLLVEQERGQALRLLGRFLANLARDSVPFLLVSLVLLGLSSWTRVSGLWLGAVWLLDVVFYTRRLAKNYSNNPALVSV